VETVRKMFPAASQARARRGVGASESKRIDAEKPPLDDVEKLLEDAKLRGLPAGIDEVCVPSLLVLLLTLAMFAMILHDAL
jgi:hypothetical protein